MTPLYGSITPVTQADESLDAAAVTWLDKLTTAGKTATATEVYAMHMVGKMLRRAGLLTKIVFLSFLIGNDTAAGMIPFIGTTVHSAVNCESGDYSSTGLAVDGVDEYINTGVPASALATGSAHLMVAVSNLGLTGATRSLMGCRVGATVPILMMRCRFSASVITMSDQGTGTATSTTGTSTATNVIAIGSSVSATDMRGYANGTQIGPTITTSRAGTLHSGHIYVMARNSTTLSTDTVGTAGEWASGTVQAYSGGAGLSPTEVVDFTNIIEMGLELLGRGGMIP